MKKVILTIIVVLAAAVLALGVVWGKRYYEARYVGTDYYAVVPQGYDMTEQPVRSMAGEQVGTGITYNLTAYGADGGSRPVSFTVYDPSSSISLGEQQPQPGQYLRVTASKQTVISWRAIDASEVPADVLPLINAGR